MHRPFVGVLMACALVLLGTPAALADPTTTTTTTVPPTNPVAPPAPLTNADVVAFGDAAGVGSTGVLNQPVVGLAATPSGNGYWLVARDGGIFAFGDAHYFGSTGGIVLNRPIVGMASSPDGGGYWFVAADGGVFSFGDARYHGSTGAMRLNQPIVGMAATPSGNGYWLVARDGGVFAFGDAVFHGSTGNIVLNKPIVGVAGHPGGNGYWFVASDGGVFAYGDAGFHGSTADLPITGTISGIASTPDGQGYWVTTNQGAVYNFGDALSEGGLTGTIAQPVVAIAASPTGHGYWLATSAPETLQPSAPASGPAIGASAMVHGLRLLYSDDESDQLLTANTDGSSRAVIATPMVPGSASISPDGTTVAAELDTGNGQLVIGVQAVTGGPVTALTQPSTAYIDTLPTFSHNGQRIAWVRTTEAATTAGAHIAAVDQATSGIWIMNADGSGQTLVPNTSDATGPVSWSPDGSRLAFTACSASSEGCTTAVDAISTDGSKRQALAAGQDPADPVWSPDGTEIAYDQGGSLFEIHPDGTGLVHFFDATVLTPANATVGLTPVAWYPDGTQLIANSTESDTNGLSVSQIVVIAKDGLSARRFPVRTESSALAVTG